MKTTTTITPLPATNEFRIENYTDYNLITVTAAVEQFKDDAPLSSANDAVTMTFPWAHSIPYFTPDVQDAVKKCVDTAKEMLYTRLEQKRKQEKFCDKLIRVLRRELAFLIVCRTRITD